MDKKKTGKKTDGTQKLLWAGILAVALALLSAGRGEAVGRPEAVGLSEAVGRSEAVGQTEAAGQSEISGHSEAIGHSGEQPEPETVTYESPIFIGKGEENRPKEILERDGRTYRLISTKIRQAKKEGELTYVTSTMPYTLEGRDEPPGTAIIEVKDDAAGTEFEAEVPLLEVKEKERLWSEDFSFPVTVEGYGADTFYLGETEIPADAELSNYGKELLTFLGLPEECYCVENVVWNGEPYEKDGNLCRDAVARGEKLIRTVEVKYGGQVRTPDIEGRQFIGIYEEIISETVEETTGEPETEKYVESQRQEQTAGTEAATVRQERERTLGERVLRWLEEHLTVVTFGGSFFLGAGAVIFLLAQTGKKKKEKKPGN